MKLSLRNLVICALLPLAAAAASAQEFKVGIVNLDRIFREASSAKAAQVKLEQEFTKREKEIADLILERRKLCDLKNNNSNNV